jgi:hypothetical protein
MNKIIVEIVALTLLSFSVAKSVEYDSDEYIVIQWGEGFSELKITPPTINGIISDTTDYDIEPGDGPTEIFIDKLGNIIVGSYNFRQVKGFDVNGNLLFNFSPNESPTDPDICRGQPCNLYVDTLLHLYTTSFPEVPFIPVISYAGTLLQKLYPFNDSSATISLMTWSTSGDLTFFCKEHGFETYSGGQFTQGGSPCFLANDGYYYASYKDEITEKFTFGKYFNPDKWGNFDSTYTFETSIPADSFYSAELLTGGDGNLLYSFVDFNRDTSQLFGIFIFDLNYKIVAEIDMAQPEGIYDLIITPFISKDGSLYEFRVRDDGLHVIKWTKE